MEEMSNPNLNEPLIIIDKLQQQRKDKPPISISLKASLFIGTISVISLFNLVPFFSPLCQGVCYYDRLFQITRTFNSFFANNISYKNSVLILTSILVDILAILTMGTWCFRSKDAVFLVAAINFYLLRYVIMEIFLLGFPNQYLFDYPGFKSIFVSYLPTNDFFFSGHTGFPVITYLEYSRYKGNFIPTLSLITLIVHFFAMLTLHGHYSIDLIIGSFSAYYVYNQTVRVLNYIKQ